MLVPPNSRPASTLIAQAPVDEATSPVNADTTAPAAQTPGESPDSLQVNARLVELERYLTEKWDAMKSLLPPQATPGERHAAGSRAENTFAQSESRMIDVAFGLSRILSLPESSLSPELVKVRRRLGAGQWDLGLRTLSDLQETYSSYYDSHDSLIEAKLKNMDIVDRMNLLRLGVYIASQQGGEPYAELLKKLTVHPLKEAEPTSPTTENRVVTVPAAQAPKQQSPGIPLDSNPQGLAPQAPSQVSGATYIVRFGPPRPPNDIPPEITHPLSDAEYQTFEPPQIYQRILFQVVAEGMNRYLTGSKDEFATELRKHVPANGVVVSLKAHYNSTSQYPELVATVLAKDKATTVAGIFGGLLTPLLERTRTVEQVEVAQSMVTFYTETLKSHPNDLLAQTMVEAALPLSQPTGGRLQPAAPSPRLVIIPEYPKGGGGTKKVIWRNGPMRRRISFCNYRKPLISSM